MLAGRTAELLSFIKKNDLNPTLILFLHISLKSPLAPSWQLSGVVPGETWGARDRSLLLRAESAERQTSARPEERGGAGSGLVAAGCW